MQQPSFPFGEWAAYWLQSPVYNKLDSETKGRIVVLVVGICHQSGIGTQSHAEVKVIVKTFGNQIEALAMTQSTQVRQKLIRSSIVSMLLDFVSRVTKYQASQPDFAAWAQNLLSAARYRQMSPHTRAEVVRVAVAIAQVTRWNEFPTKAAAKVAAARANVAYIAQIAAQQQTPLDRGMFPSAVDHCLTNFAERLMSFKDFLH